MKCWCSIYIYMYIYIYIFVVIVYKNDIYIYMCVCVCAYFPSMFFSTIHEFDYHLACIYIKSFKDPLKKCPVKKLFFVSLFFTHICFMLVFHKLSNTCRPLSNFYFNTCSNFILSISEISHTILMVYIPLNG